MRLKGVLLAAITWGFLSISGCGGGTAPSGVNIYVAVSGSDANPGTKDLPYLTLERARDEIRNLRRTGALVSCPVTVWLRGGTYLRSQSFVLTSEDTSTAQSSVTYRAYPGEEVRISGGIELSGFSPVVDPLIFLRFDPVARDHIVQVDLASFGAYDFNALTDRFVQGTDIKPAGAELYFNGAAMPLAHWPNNGWSTIVGLPAGNLSGLFTYEGERPGIWSRVQDIILYGYWRYDWFANYERVVSIDPVRHEIQTAYVPPPNPYGFLVGQRYMAINVLEELDQPGEWYLDRVSGILYFWPPGDLTGANIVLSCTAEPLMKIDGASYHTFQGMILEYGRGCGVEIAGGAHNRLAGCIVRNFGTVGVAVGGMVSDILWQTNYNPVFSGRGGTYNGVVGCDIYNTGMGGVLLGGGNRLTLATGNNYVENNDIHDYSRLANTDRPAVYLYGVGNRVVHNLLHEGPDLAIAFWGNDHVIEHNEVYRVGLAVDDGGAMKAGRDYSQRGTVIRYNHIHDLVGSVAGSHVGVYLDDFQSGIGIYGNLFHNVNVGVNIGGGRDNSIDNNIFVDCPTSVHVDARGLTWASYYFNGQNTTLFDRLAAVNYQSAPYSVRYPELATLLDGNPALPEGNRVARNIVVFSGAPTMIEGAQEYVLFQDNLFDNTPGFVAPELGDFALTIDSPAWKLGFQRIPLEMIGLYRDQYRPIKVVARR